MAWLILFATLAAWGLLCAVWAALGWLLPGSEKAVLVLVCPQKNPEAVILRCRWLMSLGLLPGRLAVADASPEQRSRLEKQFYDIEFYDPAEISAELEAEREQLD